MPQSRVFGSRRMCGTRNLAFWPKMLAFFTIRIRGSGVLDGIFHVPGGGFTFRAEVFTLRVEVLTLRVEIFMGRKASLTTRMDGFPL